MSLSLLLPSALFTLFALALPLLLHLHRRRETPPPRLFAALAYIDPQARPKQHLRLRDLLLLALRLLLLATLALLLAQPLLHGRPGAPWVLLWPGLDTAQVGEVADDAELRWLAPGFPRVYQVEAPTRDAPFSLLRQLAFEAPLERSIEIRVPRDLDGWDGGRVHTGRPLDWTVLPVELPAALGERPPLRVAVHVSPDLHADERHALSALRAYFDAQGDSAPLHLIEAVAVSDASAVDVLWVLAPAQAGVAGVAQAGVAQGAEAMPEATHPAPHKLREQAFETRQQRAEAALGALPLPWQHGLHAGWLIVISDAALAAGQSSPAGSKPADAEHEHGTPAGHSHTDTDGHASAHAAPTSQPRIDTLWHGQRATLFVHAVEGIELRLLDCGLAPSCLPELLEPHFPRLLQTWLTPTRPPTSRVDAATLVPNTGGIAPEPIGTPLRDALIAVALLLLLAERWMAATRRPA